MQKASTSSTSVANQQDLVQIRTGQLLEGQDMIILVGVVRNTGATSIALPAADANRLRIDYRKGRRGMTNTAAGPTPEAGEPL